MYKKKKLLTDFGLRNTNFRKKLLNLFQSSKSSLTVDHIKQQIGQKNDKVTIYRALNSFEKFGIIHQVPDINNFTRYALCLTKCSPSNHIHQHSHFICKKCSNTFCVDQNLFPKIQNSIGFEFKEIEIIIKGNCPTCI